jgi:hypothetical protein
MAIYALMLCLAANGRQECKFNTLDGAPVIYRSLAECRDDEDDFRHDPGFEWTTQCVSKDVPAWRVAE